MKQIFGFGSIIALCVYLLVGCGDARSNSSAINGTKGGSISQSQNQEINTGELNQYFQQAFDTKGNALNTPEQLALELAELKSLTADITLPEDFETQYEDWRKGHIEFLLKTLQEEYEQIIAGLPLFDGVNAGAAFADLIDFEGDGIKELIVLNLSWESPLYDWSCSMDVYGTKLGHATQYGTISFPPLYYCGMDPKNISFVQNSSKTYLHVHDEQGMDGFDWYYTVGQNSILTADETESSHISAEENYFFSSNKEITYEEYESIQAKYTEGAIFINNTSMRDIIPMQSRGILPALSVESQKRITFLDTLNNREVKYAKLLDFDQNGNEDLIVIEKAADRYIYCIYTWNGAEVERIPFENMYFGLDIEGGIYRKKSTGALYLYCNDFTDGAYDTTHQFSNLTDNDIISTGDYKHIQDEYAEGWHFSDEDAAAFSARLDEYEIVEEFCLYYSNYNDYDFTISDVRQKLMEK